MFLTIVLGTLMLVYGYAGIRMIDFGRFSLVKKIGVWMLVILMAWFPILPGVLRRNGHETGWVDLLSWAGYTSMGFVTLLFVLVGLHDLGKLFLRLFALWKPAVNKKQAASSAGVRISRRRFIKGSVSTGILAGSSVLTGCGFWQARQDPDIVSVDIPFKNLHKDLQGLTIAQVTDIHVGPTIKRAYVERVVALVKSLSADMIVLTGDLVDGSTQWLKDDVAPIGGLSAPFGTYFVTGNHEYYSNAPLWIERVRELGFTVLMNQHEMVRREAGRLLLAGVTDYSAGRFYRSHASNPKMALDGAKDHHLKILLAHQPKSIFAAEKAGFDLQISGHTHGGQYFPGNILVSLNQPFVAGLHQYKTTRIYVSRGTGYWGPPMRLMAPSEISLITLTSL